MSGRSKVIPFAAWILISAGIGALGYCAWESADRAMFQQREAKQFAGLPEPILKGAGRPAASQHIRQGMAFGKLTIPRLGISVVVAEGDDSGTLRHAAGHIPGTGFPGQTGNAAIAAHRDTFFRNLRNVRKGDLIVMQTSGGEYRYKVNWLRVVRPDDTGVLDSTLNESLTLITCYPFHFIGAAPERFIVRAELVGNPGARAST